MSSKFVGWCKILERHILTQTSELLKSNLNEELNWVFENTAAVQWKEYNIAEVSELVGQVVHAPTHFSTQPFLKRDVCSRTLRGIIPGAWVGPEQSHEKRTFRRVNTQRFRRQNTKVGLRQLVGTIGSNSEFFRVFPLQLGLLTSVQKVRG